MKRAIEEKRLSQVAPQLTAKLIKRLRLYLDAKRTRDSEDVQAFVNMIKREAEDLKKESFGVEVNCSFHLMKMKS